MTTTTPVLHSKTTTSNRMQVGNAAFAIGIEQSGSRYWVGWTVTRGESIFSDTPVHFPIMEQACLWFYIVNDRLGQALHQVDSNLSDDEFTLAVFNFVYEVK